jgi:hypothetical protein
LLPLSKAIVRTADALERSASDGRVVGELAEAPAEELTTPTVAKASTLISGAIRRCVMTVLFPLFPVMLLIFR